MWMRISSSPHVISSTLNRFGVRVYEYWAFGLQDCSSGCGFGVLALGLSSFYMMMWLKWGRNVTFNSLHILLSILFWVVFSRTLCLVGGDNLQIIKWRAIKYRIITTTTTQYHFISSCLDLYCVIENQRTESTVKCKI